MKTFELKGWTRTGVLALGAASGTIITAAVIHAVKKGRPEMGPRGWGRTLLLAGGAVAGTLATAGLIHIVKGGQGQALSFDSQIDSFLMRNALGGYQDALAEAAKIEKETGVAMTVEALKPVHFGWTEYKLPVGSTYITLKDKVRFYPVGIFSTDENFEALKWWEGARVRYLYDWPCFYVALKEEKQATMFPQPTFKTSFTFEVVSVGADPKVNAWIIGYIVLPETMREMKVIQ